MSNFTDETYVPSRITYRPGGDPGAIGAGKIWVDASVEPPTVKVRNKANTDWDSVGGGGSGGGVTTTIVTLAAADLEASWANAPQYPVVAIDVGTGTISIAGDHRAEFPVGANFGWNGSAGVGDDGAYQVTTVDFTGGNTVVGTSGLSGGATADGQLIPIDFAGTAIFTPNGGENVLYVGIEITEDFTVVSGAAFVSIGLRGAESAFTAKEISGATKDPFVGVSDATHNAIGGTSWTPSGNNSGVIENLITVVLGTDPITVFVDDNNGGGDPGVTAGEIKVTIVTTVVS